MYITVFRPLCIYRKFIINESWIFNLKIYSINIGMGINIPYSYKNVITFNWTKYDSNLNPFPYCLNYANFQYECLFGNHKNGFWMKFSSSVSWRDTYTIHLTNWTSLWSIDKSICLYADEGDSCKLGITFNFVSLEFPMFI